MELFVAGNDEKWRLIKRVISECDYYVLVIGGKYGSVDPETELSYTEMEYDFADSIGKPVMAFLHGQPGELKSDQIELDPAPRQRLKEFREKVEAARVVRYWTTPDALPGEVALSLIEARENFPAEGWVRASNALTPETRTELAELRARVTELTLEVETRRAASFEAPEALSQGEDESSLNLTIVGYLKSELSVEGNVQYNSRKRTWTVPVKLTWNEILAAVGPTMLHEAAETEVKSTLSDLLVAQVNSDAKLLPDGFGRLSESPTVTDQSVSDVLVQFFALGLIARGEKQRTASDTNKYWVLTESGQDQMMRMRAQRRTE